MHLNGDLNVTVNSQQLTRVTNYRYLGTEVDEALGWQSQIDTICEKKHMSSTCCLLLYTMHKRVHNNHNQSHNHAQGIKKGTIT